VDEVEININMLRVLMLNMAGGEVNVVTVDQSGSR
jgi:hypothetical protein